jgi:oligopeptide/dipeptide ABC transporter ATP-binding protein
VFRAFLRAPSGVLGLVALAFLLLVAIMGPVIWGQSARILDVVQASQNPSPHHWVGTDQLGRDIGIRIIVATRLSIGLALAAAGLGALLGIPAGIGASVLPARARSVALRGIDTLLAFPGILIAIFIGAIVGPGAVGAALGVGIAISFSFARVSSALAMSVGGREYIAAARVIGVRGPRLMFRYVLPNIAEVLAITTTVSISNSIVQVSSLSFLGLGVQAPGFDWGRMLTEGVQSFYITPASALAPAVAIAATALAFGFTGEAIARAMNPVLWARASGAPGNGTAAILAAIEAQCSRSDSQNLPDQLQSMDPREVVLEVKNLEISFPGQGRSLNVVDGVSFLLRKGETLGIVGESGSGKTMTSLAIAKLIPYPGTVKGEIKLEGRDLQEIPLGDLDEVLGSKLAVVFQDPMSSLNPALRIGTQLTEGVEVHQQLSHAAAIAIAVQRLQEVNMPDARRQLRRHPHELSGGMRQRVMIAMGLMKEPVLLIADEPTTALDVTIQAQIMDLLYRINREHRTAIMLISHNLGLVSQNCERVLVMYAGRVVEDLSIGQLQTQPLHPYTNALMAAVPDVSRPRSVPLTTIPGQAPDVASIPHGCPFHPRCPLAVDRCREERPPLVTRPGGQRVACWVANQDLS